MLRLGFWLARIAAFRPSRALCSFRATFVFPSMAGANDTGRKPSLTLFWLFMAVPAQAP